MAYRIIATKKRGTIPAHYVVAYKDRYSGGSETFSCIFWSLKQAKEYGEFMSRMENL